MVTIYGHPLSSPTNKVRMAANAAGTEYEFVVIDLTQGEQKTDKFLAINPVGQVPAMDDGGFRLFESNAIAKYLARSNNPDLYPDETAVQAVIDQWTDLVSNLVNAGITRLLYNKVIAPQVGAPVNESAIREGEEMIERAFPVIDQRLEENGHLAGDTLSIADINLLSGLDPAELLDVNLTPYPNISAWRDNLRRREFYTLVHNYYGEGILQ